jgi:menaquinone-dependent protoporphyrinogen oxidase
MKRILVAYATVAGATAEVAQVVGEEIANSGARVDALPLDEVEDLGAYDGVVVGGPMIIGWHRAASGFHKQHWVAFQHVPLAVFVTAVSLTETNETSVGGLPVFVDPNLPKPPNDFLTRMR